MAFKYGIRTSSQDTAVRRALTAGRQVLGTHARQSALFFIACTVVVVIHILLAPRPEDVLSAFYLWTVPSYYLGVCLFLFLLTWPLGFHRWTQWIWALLLWLILGFLLINLAVFNLYGFHVDLLMLEMFFLDFRGLGIPMPLLILGLVAMLGVLGVVYLIFRWAHPAAKHRMRLNKLSAGIGILGVPVLLGNQFTHAWALNYHVRDITHYTTYFPVYFPADSDKTIRKIAASNPWIIPVQTDTDDLSSAQRTAGPTTGRIQYPRAPFDCANPNPKSILLVVVESWQADTLNPQVMPNMSALAGQSIRFANHSSSGSATVPGFFGLMYGLHPTYYAAFRAQAKTVPAPLTEIAAQQGYQVRVFAAGDLDRFSLRELFFSKVGPQQFLYFDSDRQLVDRFVQLTRAEGDARPRLDVVYLTSSHSPYNYPKSHARFTPVPAVEGKFVLNKTVDPTPYKNKYKNSLAYVDDLIGEMVGALRTTGALDQRWLVITGDHGEEFNDSGLGFWGHGSSFSRWQTGTPLVLKPPALAKGRVEPKPSFHQDIAPTLIRHGLGCRNPLDDFSNGHSLFDLPDTRQSVISSYAAQAYWIDGLIWERNNGRRYNWSDPALPAQQALDATRLKALFEEEARFLR